MKEISEISGAILRKIYNSFIRNFILLMIFIVGLSFSLIFCNILNAVYNQNLKNLFEKKAYIISQEFEDLITKSFKKITTLDVISNKKDYEDVISFYKSMLSEDIFEHFYFLCENKLDKIEIYNNKNSFAETKDEIIEEKNILKQINKAIKYNNLIVTSLSSFYVSKKKSSYISNKLLFVKPMKHFQKNQKKWFSVGIIDIKKLLNKLSLKVKQDKNYSYILIDKSNFKENIVFTLNTNASNLINDNRFIFRSNLISFDDYKFELVISDNTKFLKLLKVIEINLQEKQHIILFYIFIAILVITISICLIIYNLIKKRKELENILEIRTIKLTNITQAVEENKNEILAVLYNQSDSIISINLEGYIELANNTVFNILGYLPEELEGKHINNFLIKDRYFNFELLVYGMLNSYIRSDKSKMKVQALMKSGEIKLIEITFSITSEITKKLMVVASIKDISKYIKIEKALMSDYSKELESERNNAAFASKAKNQFLVNMSHEIRTPMNSIVGTAELLLDTRLNLEQQEFVKTINTSCDVLLSIINDILDLSKIESDNITINKDKDSLPKLINEVMAMLSLKSASNNNELMVKYSPELPTEFIFDTTKLRQILINLINNSIKFSNNGTILLTVGANKKEGNSKLRNLYFEVIDNGIGIAEDKLESIFESFTQADQSTTRRFGGTGLGLAICRKLVEIMGGKIGVKSKIGHGSSFWFKIPVEFSQDLDLSLTKNNNLKLLIVDSSPLSMMVLSEYLNYYNINHDVALSCQEALKKISKSPSNIYDYVIIDHFLNDYSWLQAGAAIKEALSKNMNNTKFILLSRHNLIESSSLKEQNIFTSYLIKPVYPINLINLLFLGVEEVIQNNKEENSIEITKILAQYNINALVVEDYAPNQRLIKKMLEKFGCNVSLANGGIEAINIIKNKEFDIIFMDCQMPDMDGYETTSKVRSMEKQHTLIVAMTANALLGDREKCIDAGMDDYVAKPAKQYDIANILDKWFGCSSRTKIA